MTRLCGAKTRGGGNCRRPAGWGTPSPGYGRCKLHGGCSPSGQKAANGQRALSFAVGALGAEVAGSPLEAMTEAVGLSRGVVAYYRHQLADAALKGDWTKVEALRQPFHDAIRMEKDVAKAALDAGVAERMARQAELVGGVLSAMVEGVMKYLAEVAGVDVVTHRDAMVAAALARAESFEGQAFEEPEQITERAAA